MAFAFLEQCRSVVRGRLVASVASLCVGAAIPTIFFQRPELLRSEHSADWASALASFVAAIVALGLGLYAAKQDGRRQRERSHGAALVFLNTVTELLAYLELIEETQKVIDADKRAAEHIRAKLSEFPALLPSEALEFLPHLPLSTARLVVMSAQRVSSTRSRLSNARSHADLAAQIQRARVFLLETTLPLGNQLFSEIFGPSLSPPWRQTKAKSIQQAQDAA